MAGPSSRELPPSPRSVPLPYTARFFALRTPLLPFEALAEWNHAQEDPSPSRALLRERLRRWVEDPLVREALFIASPVLDESLPLWLEAPDSERGRKVERTLVRYFSRMVGRGTPFGLFASHAVGLLGEATRLALPERTHLRKRTRLDMDYLCALVAQLRTRPDVLRALRYVPNSSLYALAGRLRYMEQTQRGQQRTYHLVAVEPTPHMEAVLERARTGATPQELVVALRAFDAELEEDESLGYVESLIEAQLLVSTWAPTLTGPEPTDWLVSEARDIPALAEVRTRLMAATQALAAMDAEPPGQAPARYRAVARELEALPAPVELPRLFQVDAFRSARELTLSPRVVEEVLRGVEALRRIIPRGRENNPLDAFRKRFVERYESRSVPLAQVLDEDLGIGLAASEGPSAQSPLLEGFRFPSRKGADSASWGARERHLLRRLEALGRSGTRTLELTPEDLEALRVEEPVRLPDSFGVQGTLVARSARAVDTGDFLFHLENVHGPPGTLFLGRFCHGDAGLEARVREHIQAEEALRPDAVHAEIVHLPEDRLGNVICRPTLRGHDLVFLGQSGLPPSQQLHVSDLRVSVEDGQVVLRSQRLGRQVIPRLTNAHNYSHHGLALYRFLCLAQNPRPFAFRWGALEGTGFLPRVVVGRTVLHPARWYLRAAQLEGWSGLEDEALFEAVQRLRHEHGLPRWVCLQEGDNDLPVDLDNRLSVDAFAHLVRGRTRVSVEEWLAAPSGLCVEGPDGHYVNEVVLPFLRTGPAAAPSAHVPPPPRTAGAPWVRSFPPGGEWLYVKLYTGTSTADRLLRTTLRDVLQQVKETGAVERWFFLRYHDPDPHLRLRFQGDPARLDAQVWPALRTALRGVLEEGSGWRVQLDTYEREVERYGGPVGVEAAEALFAADSEAVLDLLHAYPGDAGAGLRWRLTFLGMDTLLEDLGLSLEARSTLAHQLRDAFGSEFRADKDFEAQLGQRYRRERAELEALLTPTPGEPGPWGPGREAFRRRRERLRPTVERLRQAAAEGLLTTPLEELAGSYLHMHANRMLSAEARAQELILYDFLARLYRSRLARQRTV